VRIVNEPFVMGWQGGEFLMEAHPPLAEDDRDWSEYLRGVTRDTLVDQPERRLRHAEKRIERIAADQLGVPMHVFDKKDDVYGPIRTARYVENVIVFDQVADYSSD
jgi:hypothetical protein